MIRKYYFINKFDTNNIDRLDKQTIVIYRNYNSKFINTELILKLKKYLKEKKIKLYLSNNVKLAIKLDLDGAYLPSFNKSTKHLAFSLKKNFEIIGSAHNFKEISAKIRQGCSLILLSKLFLVDYDKNSAYLGVIKFNNYFKISTKLIPLGGIKSNNLNRLNNVSCDSFALMSEVKKKPAITSRLF